MTTDTTFQRAAAPAKAASTKRRVQQDGWVYLLLGLLTFGAWWLSSLKLFTPGSRMGYWLGVAGGLTMLGVFAYPMRKHLRFMQRWGAGKYWFIVHMTVGVVGPLTILVHSSFTVGSINAGVALFAMVVVAASGVVGRFLYVRVHRNLNGERATLGEMQKSVVEPAGSVSRLAFSPKTQQLLRDFEERAGQLRWGIVGALLGTWPLTARRWALNRRCKARLRIDLLAHARSGGWAERDFKRRFRAACHHVDHYTKTVQRIAEFSAWDRLFSYWHVAHVPFVYMMVLSALVHVVAVHIY